jgi:hypothetical protein
MAMVKRATKAETPKQPSLCLRLRAPYFYPDPTYSAENGSHNKRSPQVSSYLESCCATTRSGNLTGGWRRWQGQTIRRRPSKIRSNLPRVELIGRQNYA